MRPRYGRNELLAITLDASKPQRLNTLPQREALAVKEGLVRFQPFIEGKLIYLITDHSALQWAKTYKHMNQRLASWGTVFSAYAPKLVIIHHPGCKHSNVDLLSWIPRDPPSHISPTRLGPATFVLKPDLDLASKQEEAAEAAEAEPAKRFMEAFMTTRARMKILVRVEEEGQSVNKEKQCPSESPVPGKPEGGQQSTQIASLYEKMYVKFRVPHLEMSEKLRKEFGEGYKRDPQFAKISSLVSVSKNLSSPAERFFKDRGLLYFQDADFIPRLCVPRSMKWDILQEAHEDPMVTAHLGPEQLWAKLAPQFYWHRMRIDVERFCNTCDICQKIKTGNLG